MSSVLDSSYGFSSILAWSVPKPRDVAVGKMSRGVCGLSSPSRASTSRMDCTMRCVTWSLFSRSSLTSVQPAVFTTMDITTDGFGFMLSVGDLTWVPFVYSLQARYLVFRPVELNVASTAAILAVNALGYWIFRDANGEKNDFRNGKNPKSK